MPLINPGCPMCDHDFIYTKVLEESIMETVFTGRCTKCSFYAKTSVPDWSDLTIPGWTLYTAEPDSGGDEGDASPER
jgi:hypothetical protein